jgi:hypothetical protein
MICQLCACNYDHRVNITYNGDSLNYVAFMYYFSRRRIISMELALPEIQERFGIILHWDIIAII